MAAPTLTQAVRAAVRERRDFAQAQAEQAAGTVEAVRADELVPEGCVASALNALEEARNALLEIEVMVEHNAVTPADCR